MSMDHRKILHAARYIYSPSNFEVSFECDRRIKRYHQMKQHLFHICSGLFGRPGLLRRYSSSTIRWLDLRGNVALCDSTAKLLQNHQFGVRRRHLKTIFHDFKKSIISVDFRFTLRQHNCSPCAWIGVRLCMMQDIVIPHGILNII